MKKTEEIFRQQTDYKRLILRFLGYKYYFIASVIVAVMVAYVLNKYSSRIFNNWTTILIKEEQPNSFLRSDDIMAGGLFSGISNVENELAILKSFAVVNDAVQEMNFEVDYFLEENIAPVNFIKYIKKTDLYNDSPVKVIFDQTHIQPVNAQFFVEIYNDSTYKIRANSPRAGLYNYIFNREEGIVENFSLEGIYKFGEKVENENYSFTVYLTERYNPGMLRDKELYFVFNNLNLLSLIYAANLSLSTTTTTSSVVIISLNGFNPMRITDFLNTLTAVYLEKNLEKKNKQAFSTIKFIDSRISDIADSLFFAENKLQNFRSRNQVMNLSFQGEQLYERMNQLENEKVVLIMQQKYYDYIRQYFNTNDDVSDLMAPSAMDVRDPTLTRLIGEMLDLNNQRMNYMLNNPKNLFLRDLEIQISNVKKTILENIQYSYRKAEIDLEDLESRIAKLSSQITILPRTERELIGMERQFKLNDAIYTFLLQKRAEAQIARASNYADYEIVNGAQYFNARVISPNTQMNFIIAAFLGFLIPFLIILIRDFFNNRVTDLNEVEELTTLPVVGQVYHSRRRSKAIIIDYPKSPIADSFRAIRTNLQFFAKGTDKMVILLTSTISGEGKSFCSVNLASVYALLGKKTLLLGFDLRRPSLYDDFNLANEKGITSYLINKLSVDQIIQKTQIENLDLISAGPVPPNPMELIASDKTAQFFEELKKKYDYIIIDSAPLGAIADSFLLFDYSDINIVVIRHNYTIKEAIKMNLKNIESKGVKDVTLLINDIKLKKNSYGYAYQSKYYNNTEKFSLNKMLKKESKAKK